jgi:deoxyribose-phosphate aldolase
MPIDQGTSIDLIKKIYSLIDLTRLNETDSPVKIAALCAKAVLPDRASLHSSKEAVKTSSVIRSHTNDSNTISNKKHKNQSQEQRIDSLTEKDGPIFVSSVLSADEARVLSADEARVLSADEFQILPVHVAAVCVYPAFVKQAVAALHGTSVNVATVINFPEGNHSLTSVTHAIQSALNEGAEEIDIVFPYPRYLAGEKTDVKEYLHACKLACGDHLLKVILETGALKDLHIIAAASELAIEAGADFLKTSTGKIAIGATLEAAAVMLQTIRNKSNDSVGFKVSGGVRTIPQALEYIALAEKIMGADWVTPAHFRIGASQLADVLLQQWAGVLNS